MSAVDCNAEMSKYNNDKVTLQKSDQDDMRTRRDAGRTRLKKGLGRDGHPAPDETASQGSYAMRTMVQDADSDYDIDDGAYFKKDNLKDANGNELTPYAARLRVCIRPPGAKVWVRNQSWFAEILPRRLAPTRSNRLYFSASASRSCCLWERVSEPGIECHASEWLLGF